MPPWLHEVGYCLGLIRPARLTECDVATQQAAHPSQGSWSGREKAECDQPPALLLTAREQVQHRRGPPRPTGA